MRSGIARQVDAYLGTIGYFDDETIRVEPIDNPFGAKCYLCLRPE